MLPSMILVLLTIFGLHFIDKNVTLTLVKHVACTISYELIYSINRAQYVFQRDIAYLLGL